MLPLTVAILLYTAAIILVLHAVRHAGGLIFWWDVCCPEQAPRWSCPEFERAIWPRLPQIKRRVVHAGHSAGHIAVVADSQTAIVVLMLTELLLAP